MILERSPHSSKHLTSAIDQSLARARSQKIWATEKFKSIDQPLALQRIFRSDTTIPEPTAAPGEEQSTRSSHTSPSQGSVTNATVNPSSMKKYAPTLSNMQKQTEPRRTIQKNPKEPPTTESRKKLTLLPKLNREVHPTKYTAKQTTLCDTPTKAPISTINYGLPRDHTNVQLAIPFQPCFAHETSTVKIFDKHPTSLGGKPENTRLNTSNTHNFASETSNMNFFNQHPISLAGDRQSTNPIPSNAQYDTFACSTPDTDQERFSIKTHPLMLAQRASELGMEIDMSPSPPTMILG